MTDGVRPEEIEALVAEFEASGCAELHIRFDGFELHLSSDAGHKAIARQSAQTSDTPAIPAVTPPVTTPLGGPGADDLDGFEIVRAPYLGTFYRSPKPGEPAYVEIGSVVTAETELCLVEVMKLFTAVRAGVGGTVARLLATDGQMVETGQPLFAISPEG